VVGAYKEAGDDYSYIMAEALADRLAEALAEKLHELVRREDWGYAPGESLSVEDMLKVKYQVRGGGGRGAGAGRAVCGSCEGGGREGVTAGGQGCQMFSSD
jgi:hypothetical protein